MNNHSPKRECLIFYTTAVCNLKCSYCYIDKNPALQKIDKILDDSFQGDYYFNFAKKMFSNSEDLKEIGVWGGEPTLRLDRIYYTLEKLIPAYPNLKRINFSTNFTTNNWFEQIGGLIDVLHKFAPRVFNLDIQLSLDGPTEINDMGRGKGVTKLFIEHWKELLNRIENNFIPDNVVLNTWFKPTLSIETIPLLQTKENIIKDYQFIETFKESCIYYESEKFHFELSIPNTACPSPHTKNDGILFANLCKLCREIERENKENKYFKYYHFITPFPKRNDWNHECVNCADSTGMCGMGLRSIGLLPDNKLSLCHNGFVDLISDYKKYCIEQEQLNQHSIDFNLFNKNKVIRDTNCTIEEFEEFEKILKSYYNNNSTFQLGQLVNQIQCLAMFDMIDRKYIDDKEATEAAHFIQHSTSYCIRDNLGSSGTVVGYPMGLIKLLLNGAKEYILNEDLGTRK